MIARHPARFDRGAVWGRRFPVAVTSQRFVWSERRRVRMELTVQPCLGHAPLPLHRRRGDREYLRGLFDTQATKEPELDNPALALIQGSESVQGFVERNQINRARLSGKVRAGQRGLVLQAAALDPLTGAGMIHEDSTHRLRRDPKKMRTILPLNLPLFDESQIGLVHERGRLQRVIRALASKVAGCLPSKLAIHERQQIVNGILVAGAEGFE
jgi:hypothetical protein